ncbi:phospholipase A and acyltransferase 4-like [Physella acuta]|uniref:phospholipase A and acyltransferase 4-like n=1 Tax=Physella acuta TaxID=109671 RepID=UPI0027DDD1EF|nr:phospholipase A and acyltransferase 4-like [Physella acuta]
MSKVKSIHVTVPAVPVVQRGLSTSILEHAKPGDLLEFKRGVYSHWAVYTGDGKVIHFTGGEDKFNYNNAMIQSDELWKVAGSSPGFVNNILDHELKSLPTEVILENATSKLGATGYNPVFANCEHFATWCRYGTARSIQVEAVREAMVTMTTQAQKTLDQRVQTESTQKDRDIAKLLMAHCRNLYLLGDFFYRQNLDEELKKVQQKTEEGQPRRVGNKHTRRYKK